jgi:hypothetical protein
MDVPGGDLLDLAMSVIQSQNVNYFQQSGGGITRAGTSYPEYSAHVAVNTGSFQPIPQTRVAQLGLDVSKSYATWYVSSSVVGVSRTNSGDCVEYNGRRYQIQAVVPWFSQDGWVAATCVDIGYATGSP